MAGALLLTVLLSALLTMGALLPGVPPAAAQTGGWSEPVVLSNGNFHAWFPDIALDGDGRIHVVYDAADIPLVDGQVMAGIMYVAYHDGAWGTPTDLVLGTGTGNIFRPSIAVDALGTLHMAHSRDFWYRSAPVERAGVAAAWSRHILDTGITYISDIASDSRGVLHLVYEKWVLLEQPITRTVGSEVVGLSDIFYRQSTDGGRSWTLPVNLSDTPDAGSHRVQLEIDARDTLYVSWDEGWDRWSLYGEPNQGLCVSSSDGGESWSAPSTFSRPGAIHMQTALGVDNRGGVLLVWRSTAPDQLWYSWSADGGSRWTPAREVPGVFARSAGDTLFDAYDMATDSAGHVHLLAVGRPWLPQHRAEPVPLGVFHLVWDGSTWSAAEPVALYEADQGFPEYPRLAVGAGNQLHAVWFVRDQQFGGAYYQILYSRGSSGAPYQAPLPVPTDTPLPPPNPTPLPPATATPFPTIVPGTSQPPAGLYTENDELGQLALALSPILLVALGIAGVRLGWAGRVLSALRRKP